MDYYYDLPPKDKAWVFLSWCIVSKFTPTVAFLVIGYLLCFWDLWLAKDASNIPFFINLKSPNCYRRVGATGWSCWDGKKMKTSCHFFQLNTPNILSMETSNLLGVSHHRVDVELSINGVCENLGTFVFKLAGVKIGNKN